MWSSLLTITATTLIASQTKNTVAIKGITSPNTEGTETCIVPKTLQQGDLLMPMVTGKGDHKWRAILAVLRTAPSQVVDRREGQQNTKPFSTCVIKQEPSTSHLVCREALQDVSTIMYA